MTRATCSLVSAAAALAEDAFDFVLAPEDVARLQTHAHSKPSGE
ncbi:MAG: hypothetical protein ACK6CU_10270 [Deltaproteobacteria bacterium]